VKAQGEDLVPLGEGVRWSITDIGSGMNEKMLV
jgi:hypothetical protein